MHKILQAIYFTTHVGEFDDDLSNMSWVIEYDELLNNCIRQWHNTDAIITFPSKSINVAVIYSTLLADIFGGTVLDYLSDPDLMYGMDKYYKPYPEYQTEYDAMMSIITVESIRLNRTPSVKATIKYFNQEFMIGSLEFDALLG